MRTAELNRGAASAIAKSRAVIDWTDAAIQLDVHGCAIVGPLLSPKECRAISDLYGSDEPFRSRIVMARHGFGSGEYKYFAYPLPSTIAKLRATLYPELARIANRWNAQMGIKVQYPATHDEFLQRCHKADQADAAAAAIWSWRLQLSAPGSVRRARVPAADRHSPLRSRHQLHRRRVRAEEQRPRMQSRAEVVPLRQGEGVIFPVHHRPVQGTRGIYRVNMRHGVSRLRSGQRHTLGIIFHDAK